MPATAGKEGRARRVNTEIVTLRAVVFDIGGVLEDTQPTGWQARWAARLRLDRAEFDRRLGAIFAAGSIGAIALPEVERRIAATLELGRPELHAFMDDVWAEYAGTLNHELAAYFAALRPGYRTGILSNSFVGAREREQARYGFQDMCDVIVYSHEEGCAKPDPRSYTIVCERLGVPAAGTVFLDDVPANVDGARAVGMTAIRFADTRQAVGDLERVLAPAQRDETDSPSDRV